MEPELSYRVVGALFRVYNALGPGLQEKHYQRALTKIFREEQVEFQEQVPVPIAFEGASVGRYFVDFVIDKRLGAGNQAR